jgi:hypothetical protein
VIQLWVTTATERVQEVPHHDVNQLGYVSVGEGFEDLYFTLKVVEQFRA